MLICLAFTDEQRHSKSLIFGVVGRRLMLCFPILYALF